MRRIGHFKERYNVENAARQLGMSVPALGQRIQDGEITTQFVHGYTFIAADEIDAFADRRQQEFEAAQQAESARAAQEQREKDGAHVARLMSEAQDIASRYGYDPTQD